MAIVKQPPINVSQKHYQELITLLEKYMPNTCIWAYGSRIKGNAKTHSDLDLVAFSKPEQQTALFNLKEAFEESNLPFRVDLFSWDEIPEDFQNNIKKNKVVIYNGETTQQIKKL